MKHYTTKMSTPNTSKNKDGEIIQANKGRGICYPQISLWQSINITLEQEIRRDKGLSGEQVAQAENTAPKCSHRKGD